MLPDTLHKSKTMIKAPVIQIVKKETTYPPGFITMRQIKIVITPLLIFIVIVWINGITGQFGLGMPVNHIFLKGIIGCQVKASAKPPDRITTFFFSNKKTHISMGRGDIGIFRMYHQRNAHCFKRAACQLRPFCGC